MPEKIEIVESGRGPQLSTSRVTVQDLVPYLQQRCSYQEIIACIPSLSIQEIQAIERYLEEHYEAVMEETKKEPIPWKPPSGRETLLPPFRCLPSVM